jgi:glucosamine--fructose-6-phosphate aminotransferase (isomerizing)
LNLPGQPAAPGLGAPREGAARSQMRAEALEAPAAVARALTQDGERYATLAAQLQAQPPRALLTLARGSSDHAASYGAYLLMARLGQLVASLPMSLLTLQPPRLRADGLVALAFSQSGRSPDLVGPTAHLRASGATTVAFVNDAASPLAAAAEWLFPLHAGPEASVAATKSYIAQLLAAARLVAAWETATTPQLRAAPGGGLAAALPALPEALSRAAAMDWTAALPLLQDVERLYVVGRGTGLAVALEAALKFKETCGIQAEAFSGAELRHGPMALVGVGYPVLVLAPRGPAQEALLALAAELQARGARVLLAAPPCTPGVLLPLAPAPHEDLDPLCMAQSFYGMVEALARERGRNPDAPAFLSKVTLTR